MSGASFVARLPTDEATAKRLSDLLGDTFDLADIAVAAYAAKDGAWTVEILFHQQPDEAAVRHLVASVAGARIADAFAFETVADRDWVAASIAGLALVEAGRFVVHGAHDRARVAANRIGIEIEAALAFGTGHHGTTRACLLALHAFAKPSRRPRRILDIGTGSGVLAIAAARAFRRPVLASDIDRRAVTVARENATRNRAGAFVRVIHAAGIGARMRPHGRYDLVLANILLGSLKGLATALVALLAPGGRAVLSGLLPVHAAPALAAYRARGLVLERRIMLDGWVTLVMRRRAISPTSRLSSPGLTGRS